MKRLKNLYTVAMISSPQELHKQLLMSVCGGLLAIKKRASKNIHETPFFFARARESITYFVCLSVRRSVRLFVRQSLLFC